MPTEISFDKQGFETWLKEHEVIRPLATLRPPWFKYQLKSHPVCKGYLYSYDEDGNS